MGLYQRARLYLSEKVGLFQKVTRCGRNNRKSRVDLPEGAISLDEAARRLRVPRDSLARNFRYWGAPYYLTVSGKVYFHPADLDQWKQVPRVRRSLSRVRLLALKARKDQEASKQAPSLQGKK